jgi:hypothetical protein
VFGKLLLPGDSAQHVALSEAGRIQDCSRLLPTNSRWKLLDSTAVNDAGQMVGCGTTDGQTMRAVLLTPARRSTLRR